jgi:chromosome segregation ATPase
MRCTVIVAIFICDVLFLAVTTALGGYGGGGMGVRSGGGSSSSSAPRAEAPPPIDRTASTKARRDVNAATADVNKANNEVAAIVAKLRIQFEQTPEWKDRQAALKSAQAELDAARHSVLETLKSQPEYRSAKAALEKAEADREALRNEPNAAPDTRTRVATAAFESVKAVSTLESLAVAADPKAAAAEAKVADAKKAQGELVKKFQATLPDDANWQAATKGLEEKKQVLATAQKGLTDALAQETAAERERQKQMAQAR